MFIPDPHCLVQETLIRPSSRKVGGASGGQKVKNVKRGTHSEWRETLGETDYTATEQ